MTLLGGPGPENRTIIRFCSPPRSYPRVAEMGQHENTKHENKQNGKHEKHENGKYENTRTRKRKIRKHENGKYEKTETENTKIQKTENTKIRKRKIRKRKTRKWKMNEENTKRRQRKMPVIVFRGSGDPSVISAVQNQNSSTGLSTAFWAPTWPWRAAAPR